MSKIGKIFFGFLFLFTVSIDIVSASSLSLSPNSGTYRVGDTIVVRVVVSSTDQSINAVASRLVYPTDKISISSISKSGSIISIWAQEPSFSNSSGTASFEGVILNGYIGSGARVASVNFIAKSVGEATVSFSGSSVLANDGEGTNTLVGQNQAIFTILPAEAKSNILPIPEKTIKEDVTKKIKNITKSDEPKMITPVVVNYYTNTLGGSDVLLIIVWVILLLIMVVFYVYYRFQIQKKIIKIKKLTERNFKILKEDQNNPEKLKKDLENAKNVIVSGIQDIEKT